MEQKQNKILFECFSAKYNKKIILTYIGYIIKEDTFFITLQDRKIGILRLNKKDIKLIKEIKKEEKDDYKK